MKLIINKYYRNIFRQILLISTISLKIILPKYTREWKRMCKSVRNKVSEGEFLKKTDPKTFLIRKRRQTCSNFRPPRIKSHQVTRPLGADKVSGTSINPRFWVASHQYTVQTSKPTKGSLMQYRASVHAPQHCTTFPDSGNLSGL